MNMNLKIKCLRRKVKSRSYHSDRIKRLLDHKDMLDERFKIFEMGGIVGDRIWALKGGEYLDYAHRIRPMIIKRIDWHKKRQHEQIEKKRKQRT